MLYYIGVKQALSARCEVIAKWHTLYYSLIEKCNVAAENVQINLSQGLAVILCLPVTVKRS